MQLDWLKQRYYRRDIPLAKLRQAVEQRIEVTQDEIEREYRLRYGRADVDVIAVPTAAITNPTGMLVAKRMNRTMMPMMPISSGVMV